MVVLFLLTLVFLSTDSNLSIASQAAPSKACPWWSPPWVINQTVYLVNQHIQLEGGIEITDGSCLILRNTELEFIGERFHEIKIQDGGSLHLLNGTELFHQEEQAYFGISGESGSTLIAEMAYINGPGDPTFDFYHPGVLLLENSVGLLNGTTIYKGTLESYYPQQLQVSKCVFDTSEIWISGGEHVVIQDTSFTVSDDIERGSGTVLLGFQTHNLVLLNNQFSKDAQYAIQLLETSSTLISNNAFNGSRKTTVAIYSSIDVVLVGNKFSGGQGTSLGFENVIGGVIAGNNFTNTSIGLSFNSSYSVKCYLNNFMDNTVHFRSDTATSVTLSSLSGVQNLGNFWEGLEVIDLDHDKIADAPVLLQDNPVIYDAGALSQSLSLNCSSDFVSNLEEDQDNDLLTDLAEMCLYGTNKGDNDTDMDGLSDGDEVLKYRTNPLKQDPLEDSDSDGLPNVWEVTWGLDPLDELDALIDLDNDGLANLQEFHLGTNIHLWDTDSDGVQDGLEYAMALNATNPDSDNDGLSDGDEIFQFHTNPLKIDSDGDSFTDRFEVNWGSDPNSFLDNPPIQAVVFLTVFLCWTILFSYTSPFLWSHINGYRRFSTLYRNFRAEGVIKLYDIVSLPPVWSNLLSRRLSREAVRIPDEFLTSRIFQHRLLAVLPHEGSVPLSDVAELVRIPEKVLEREIPHLDGLTIISYAVVSQEWAEILVKREVESLSTGSIDVQVLSDQLKMPLTHLLIILGNLISRREIPLTLVRDMLVFDNLPDSQSLQELYKLSAKLTTLKL